MNKAPWDFLEDMFVVVRAVEMWTVDSPTNANPKCGWNRSSYTDLSTVLPEIRGLVSANTHNMGMFSTFPQSSTGYGRKNGNGCTRSFTVCKTWGRVWTDLPVIHRLCWRPNDPKVFHELWTTYPRVIHNDVESIHTRSPGPSRGSMRKSAPEPVVHFSLVVLDPGLIEGIHV